MPNIKLAEWVTAEPGVRAVCIGTCLRHMLSYMHAHVTCACALAYSGPTYTYVGGEPPKANWANPGSAPQVHWDIYNVYTRYQHTNHVSCTLQVVLLSEIEPYRVYDPATSRYHSGQTAHISPGHLTFVAQGKGGAISLMLVGAAACINHHPLQLPVPTQQWVSAARSAAL